MVTIVVVVNFTGVQNYLARKAADILSKNLKTKVTVAHVRIDFLNHFLLQGLYVEDQAHDTLLYAGEVQVRITDWFIFKDKPVLHYIALHNAYARLYRSPASDTWNYTFIIGEKDTTKKRKPIEFDLKKVELENIRFHIDDHWVGEDLDFDVGNLNVNAKDLNFDKKILDVSDIIAKNTAVSIREYKGGRPPRPGKNKGLLFLIDPTPFNPNLWVVTAKKLSLDGCSFHLTSDDRIPAADVFDETHIAVKNIQLTASGINIIGDTLHGSIDHLSAQDRCGLAIKNMHSKVSVSPVASICSNLYLETNYSKLTDYYAMHYKRFPDFLFYIDSVVMEAHLKDAVVDKRDIAYFAPQLKKFPAIVLHASGDGKGTVANLSAHHLVVSDGTTAFKGNVTMKGLPDIYSTYITYTDGVLLTTGSGILHYVPGLKNSPDIALESITYAIFKGKYEGYIENFAVNGSFITNLGTISTNIKMNIPGFNGNTAVYSGKVAADNVQIGTFLKQPLLGSVTLDEDISGSSFDPDHVQLKIDGTIKEFTLKGYPYHNIITHGTLAKKQFNGTLLVDDPNLALEFDGGINYSDKNVNIKATAHLLGSNFYALNLTKDTITASADFDLDCTGSNIDNFSGYAKLFNIDLKRNSHRLALDSIYVNSAGDNVNKLLTIQSNDIVAKIKGNYQLSKLPASVQYYLSRYIPNYIKVPAKFAPDQNLEFSVKTYTIDSILAVAIPLIRGFDSATVSGSLNTSAQKLTLNASIPNGSIGNFHMTNITISGLGNLNQVALNTTIDNVAIGDSIVNGSLSLTASIGNDSVAFTVATTSPDTSSSITLNGQILARKDSLFLTLLPSQFYLNQAKWDIAGGSKVVYSDKYLLVQGLALTSGLQRITAATELQSNDKSLVINTENLDIGQLGSWAGFAAYQPDGRVNGSIKIDKIFGDLFITANIKAIGVMLGTDTVGTVNISGSYDGGKKLVNLSPQTGIYRGNASVIASGNISFDSATHQKLDGSIDFNNASVAWASPFLIGIMSHLSGTVNGRVAFNGSSYSPEMSGTVTLSNAGLHIDYIGCNYIIPHATVSVDNRRISFSDVLIRDSYKNTASLSGHFSHNLFKDMRMHLAMKSDKFEVLNLTSNDNNIFYGNVTARVDSFTLRGPFNNIRLNVYNVSAVAKSRIYIPVSSGGGTGSYSYASFKTYGKAQEKVIKKNRNKIHVTIDANLNTLAEMHIILDPSSGDEIMARGDGNIQLDIPPANDISIVGLYTIDNGLYTYTFKKLLILRQFKLISGSTISFNGPFSETSLNVDAIYSAKARLYDLLNESDKPYVTGSELIDAQTPQWVDINLHMTGSLSNQKLTFDLDMEDKHSQSSLAYKKLMLINYDDREKLNQVASLLLINSFIPPEGVGTGTVATGTINNLSQVVSSSASVGLTNVINKITGDKELNINVKYENYNYSDQTSAAAINRNQLKLGVSKNYFNDRLLVEVGSTSDWGKPTSTANTSNFNITGDFRIQYLLSHSSGMRINAFRTSDYDVTLDRDIIRSGVGINWRKSFDNLGEFFRSNRANELLTQQKAAQDTVKH
ncbi:MAG: translocation/assembly module TamB domain-containing protein [Legionellales bacterium]